MKRFVLIAALATVAACSQSEPAPAPDTGDDATMAAADTTADTTAPAMETMAADGKPSVGKYQVTSADGEVTIEEVKADGTYVDTRDGKVIETGKWDQQSSAVWCWTRDGEGAKQVCSDEKVENGVYTSTNRETGKTSKVVRLES